MPGGDQLNSERRDHRAVVGAQRQRRDAQCDPRLRAARGRDLAQAGVGHDSAAEQQARDAVLGARVQRFADQHVDDRFAEARRNVGDRRVVTAVVRRLHVPRDRGLET